MKLFIILLFSACCFNVSFSQQFKLILSVNDEIVRTNDVCNMSIQTKGGENYTLDYQIVELIFTDSFENKLQVLNDTEELLITIDYLCKHLKRKTFELKIKSYLLKRDYIIIRIYTKNKKNKKKYYFSEEDQYLWEYDSYSQSSRILLNPNFFQRIFR